MKKDIEMANKEMNWSIFYSHFQICVYVSVYVYKEDFEGLYIYILRRETFSICWIK